MQLKVCDVCATEGEIKAAKYTVGFPHSGKMHLCVKHQDTFKGMNREKFVAEALKIGLAAKI